MKPNEELELKMLLNAEDFYRLLAFYPDILPVTQVNTYFASKHGAHYAFRIRTIDETKHVFTLKHKTDGKTMEYEKSFSGSFKNDPDIMATLEKFDEKPPFKVCGYLTTVRRMHVDEYAELCFDINKYNGLVDYELEYEVKKPHDHVDAFKKILEQAGLEYVPNKISKYRRCLNTVKPAELHRLTDRIWYTDLDDFTDRPCLEYVLGNEASLLFDSGNSLQHGEQLKQLLRDNNLPMPDYIVNSHHHWDHCYGNKAFGGKIISCQETYDLLSEFKKIKWDNEAFEKHHIEPFIEEYMRNEYDDLSEIEIVLPEITFEDHYVVDLGGVTVQLAKVENPHCSDSVIGYVPEEKVIFTADACYKELTYDGWVNRPEKVKAMYEVLDDLDFDLSVNAHTGVATKKKLLKTLKERF